MPPLVKPKQNNVLRPASPDEITKLIQKGVKPQNTHAKFLVEGYPGIGKTFLCATAERALIAVTEASISLGTLAYAQEVLGREIHYVPISSAPQMDGLLLYLEQKAAEGDCEYEVFCVDSITAYCRLVGHELGGDEMIFEVEDLDEQRNPRFWQALDAHMRQFLERLRQLPMHVICTALPRQEGKTLLAAVYPRQLRNELGSYFNLVGFLDRASPLVEEKPLEDDEGFVPRVLYFDRAGVVTKNAGARKMPAKIVNPTWQDILRIWAGGGR